jgi:hypothetical protein
MFSGRMRRAKLLLVDDPVAIAVERQERRGCVLDLVGVEPVIMIAIERFAERIEGGRARWTGAESGRGPAARATRRLGEGKGADAPHCHHRDKRVPRPWFDAHATLLLV